MQFSMVFSKVFRRVFLLLLELRTSVIIPLLGLHTHEKYFPERVTSKAERFLGGNKKNVQKFSFMPFGEGPRTCLAERKCFNKILLCLFEHVLRK